MSNEEECEKCAESLGSGHRFCTACGRPTGAVKKESTLSAAVRAIGVLIMIACTAMLFFEIYAVIWGFGRIMPDIGNYLIPVLILTPAPAVLMYVSGLAAELWYLFIVIAVLSSFVMILYTSRSGLKELLRGNISKMDDMPLFGVTTVFAAVLSFNIIFNMIVMASGNEPSAPVYSGPDWGMWYQYLNAAVWEEVLCRVLLIGLPIAVLGLMSGEKGSWKRLFGRFEMNGTSVIFIFIAASIFSYGHLAGWDVFKLAPTFVSGIALGYLFVKFGIHAAVIMHLITNYLSSASWILGDTAGDAVLTLFMLLIMIFGVIFLVRYARRGIRWIANTLSAEDAPETVT